MLVAGDWLAHKWCLTAGQCYLRCSAIHHGAFARTTNLVGRAFVEQKRRTKTFPLFWIESSRLPVLADSPGKLVFAALWRVSRHRQWVHMSEFEQHQLL
ncbi:MAG: hypothetical protein BMS9Abin28_0892 [Anaerolineae bacterium]|nr:MAG: hypothetical protein BMS9Abin28_0892 [Anaerolineae bacterium]